MEAYKTLCLKLPEIPKDFESEEGFNSANSPPMVIQGRQKEIKFNNLDSTPKMN
jgi:hypothetical protein